MDLREIHQIGADTRERLIPPAACPSLVALGIGLVGISEARPGFRWVRLAWERPQVIACTAGSGQVLVEGRWLTLGPDQAYLTPPGVLHAYHCPPGGSWTIAWVTFLEWRGPACGPGPSLVPADAQGLSDAIHGLHGEVLGAADPAALAAWASLTDLLARRVATAATADSLDALWREVSADPARPWSLAGLARRAGISPEELRRRCQRRLGRPPMAQVTALRLRQAALLLAGGRLPVAAVAVAVGYANPFAFSTAFRRHHGRPPSHWALGCAPAPPGP